MAEGKFLEFRLPSEDQGIFSSFINGRLPYAENDLGAQLVANNPKKGEKVLSVIERELSNCQTFALTVAFVRMSGIEPLLQVFRDLEKKGIEGRILTTDYGFYTEPKALEKLHEFKNLSVRLYRTTLNNGFHTKGYIFDGKNSVRIIIGSSNLTSAALTTNKEWNTRIVLRPEGRLAEEVKTEFENLWNSEFSQSITDSVINSYSQEYKQHLAATREFLTGSKETISGKELKPNSMQQSFIRELLDLRGRGEKRALLISATGTGKTYAAAFGVRALNPRRFLFVVHREQIARQAERSFCRVLGGKYSYGFLSGNAADYESSAIFATMQTLSKPWTLKRFRPDAFDVIVIDEVHRAGAQSYQDIMAYFNPKMWIGMTASPDRTDGFDIYKLFDHNIACEIRLKDALSEDLLCPFHYFGIGDLEVDGVHYKDPADFRFLTSDERVEWVLREAKFFGWSGPRVKGLVFCSTLEEAEELSRKFRERGLRALSLSGKNSQEEREEAIERLTGENSSFALDYIFTVDIFNEGVDIPEINQVIMLRPTESAIIFVQQLGRGLRKAPGKEFVVILDFISNYSNNYLIPVALSGDRSYIKDGMRAFVASGTRLIPGASSIHFDEVTKERIYQAIDHAKTNSRDLLKEAYKQLKFKLGRIPALQDFEDHGSIDPAKFFDMSGKATCYSDFLAQYEKDIRENIPLVGLKMLRFLSSKIGEGERPHEAIVLKTILQHLGEERDLMTDLRNELKEKTGIEYPHSRLLNTFLLLSNNFTKGEPEKNRNVDCVFVEEKNGRFHAANLFCGLLRSSHDFRKRIEELVRFVLRRNKTRYANPYPGTDLVLNKRYTYDSVCRLLNWSRNLNGQNIGGYFYDKETKTLPVFINYEKDEGAIAYQDHFVNEGEIIALSKTNRTARSTDAERIYKEGPDNLLNKIYLFVRKNKDDDEAKSFYFLGEITAFGKPAEVTLQNKAPAFEICYRLKNPVRSDIYDYLTGA